MKKKFICLLLSLLCVFAFAGCEEHIKPKTIELEKMTEFMEIDCEGTKCILVHKETKVMYLFVRSGYGGGLTVMVDENGYPLCGVNDMEEKKLDKDINVRSKKILANRVYSDETLKKWKKEDLIEQIRILEHNWAAAEESLNIQAKNCEMLLKQKGKDTAKEILDEISKYFGGRHIVEQYKKYGLDWDIEVE